jgi:hypothetical protein
MKYVCHWADDYGCFFLDLVHECKPGSHEFLV